jgi:hypothetical protein
LIVIEYQQVSIVILTTIVYTQNYSNVNFEIEYNDTRVFPFNIRDIEIYEELSLPELEDSSFYFSAIMSCINNGILFFHYHEINDNSTGNLDKTIEFDFNTSHRINIEEAGRIFSEKSFRDKGTELFNFYVATRSPPAVIQMAIDQNNNVNIVRIYGQSFRDVSQRYFSEDYVTVNRDYIAQLLFDTHNVELVARIYFRNETNFSSGHAHIRLNNFVLGISTMAFLDWKNRDTIFIRNFIRWETFLIQEDNLIINTNDYKEQYQRHLNNSYQITVNATNQFILGKEVTRTFNITLTDWNDMETYVIGRDKESPFAHTYGDRYYSRPIGQFFSGPNKNFGLKSEEGLR